MIVNSQVEGHYNGLHNYIPLCANHYNGLLQSFKCTFTILSKLEHAPFTILSKLEHAPFTKLEHVPFTILKAS